MAVGIGPEEVPTATDEPGEVLSDQNTPEGGPGDQVSVKGGLGDQNKPGGGPGGQENVLGSSIEHGEQLK